MATIEDSVAGFVRKENSNASSGSTFAMVTSNTAGTATDRGFDIAVFC